jgi:uncharacterized protein (DUF2235 family)
VTVEPPPSGKNVVVCLDGTGNQFNQHNTNVVKLFRVLQRDPATQVAYYDPGVGTLADPEFKTPVAKKVDKALGLAFGSGLSTNIKEAYSFLMDSYEDGDRLFLFGFSRGAYTARALAGLIHCCGLLEQRCQNLIPYAMKLFNAADKVDFQVLARFRSTYARKYDVRVNFLGLWDTVSTYGWVYDPIALPYTTNNPSVEVARHALAIDERRVFFRPRHWGTKDRCDVREVWFAGVHSDVGGGYPEPESGLAKIALEWMIEEARPFELLIDDDRYEMYVHGTHAGKPHKNYVGPDAEGPQHESLKGAWWAAEYLPQRVWDPIAGRRHMQWVPQPARSRPIPPGSTLHPTVLSRMKAGSYAPPNLPSHDECVKTYNIWDHNSPDEREAETTDASV